MAHGPVISHVAVIVISFFRTMNEAKEFHVIRVLDNFVAAIVCSCHWHKTNERKATKLSIVVE